MHIESNVHNGIAIFSLKTRRGIRTDVLLFLRDVATPPRANLAFFKSWPTLPFEQSLLRNVSVSWRTHLPLQGHQLVCIWGQSYKTCHAFSRRRFCEETNAAFRLNFAMAQCSRQKKVSNIKSPKSTRHRIHRYGKAKEKYLQGIGSGVPVVKC
jgi:hypothetical protein